MIEKSTVYFIPDNKINYDTIKDIVARTKYFDNLNGKRNIGIKVHFGEDGNKNYLNPEYARIAVSLAKEYKANPTLIETSTLYRGARQNRATHIKLAEKHGFNKAFIGAGIEIIDGERGEEYTEVQVKSQKLEVKTCVKRAKIAKGLDKFSGLLNLAHYKGHFVVGFGGVLKNIAMGLAAKGGKLEMHSQTKPWVKQNKCTKCETCLEVCPSDAIMITEKSAVINKNCIGCASCIEACPQGAISINWNEGSESTQKKMAEYAWAILKDHHCLHFNFALKITPNCDCMNVTEKPIMDDIGVFISYDPVACDMAVWEKTKHKINKLYPELNPQILLDYAEELGLGNKNYEIIEV
jgi:uncharacterized Fe-S center protein